MQVNQVRAGAILSYVSMAVSTILSLVYAPIMKGQLGTSEYGVYGSVGPINAFLLLLSMGLGSAYMRYYSQAKVAQDRRTMAKLNGMFLVTYTVLGLVLLVLCYYRSLSRNISKRTEENYQYYALKDRVDRKFRGLKDQWANRKLYHYYRCPKCRQKLRVPRGRGRIQISCPRCGTQFIKKS